MSLMRKLTCGFQELSLSLLEIWGNVKGVRGRTLPSAFFASALPLPQNHPFGNKLFTKNMYHYLSIAHI